LRLLLLGHPLPSIGLTIEGIHQTRFATFLSGVDVIYRAVLTGYDSRWQDVALKIVASGRQEDWPPGSEPAPEAPAERLLI
jgi:hypothetical protein